MLAVLLLLPLGEDRGEGQRRWRKAHGLFVKKSAPTCASATAWHFLPLVPANLAGAAGWPGVGSVPPGDAAPGALQRHGADASMGHAFNSLFPISSVGLWSVCPARGVCFGWQAAKPAACPLPAPLALTPTLSQKERGSSWTSRWTCHRPWSLQERIAQCSL